MSQEQAKLDAIRALIEGMAEKFSAEVFPVRPGDMKVSARDILAILDEEQPERVYGIYNRFRGTVMRRDVPGYAWVRWDGGGCYPVSEDSLGPESELDAIEKEENE